MAVAHLRVPAERTKRADNNPHAHAAPARPAFYVLLALLLRHLLRLTLYPASRVQESGSASKPSLCHRPLRC